MNKESSIKQLKRIKQEMTHADDVNALDFAIRFMGNKTLDKIRTEIIESSTEDYEYHGCGTDELIIETSEVLNILNKYMAESEVQDADSD